MKILSIAILGYALYQYFGARKNYDSLYKDINDKQSEEKDKSEDSYYDYQDDISQMENQLDAETMSAYDNTGYIVVTPIFEFWKDTDKSNLMLQITNKSERAFFLNNIVANFYVKITAEILNVLSYDNANDTYSLIIRCTSEKYAYGGEFKGRTKNKIIHTSTLTGVKKYKNEYYVPLKVSNFYTDKATTINPHQTKIVELSIDREEFGDNAYKFNDYSDAEIVLADAPIINSALFRQHGDNFAIDSDNSFSFNDVLFANIKINYDQMTNNKGYGYDANMVFEKAPVLLWHDKNDYLDYFRRFEPNVPLPEIDPGEWLEPSDYTLANGGVVNLF